VLAIIAAVLPFFAAPLPDRPSVGYTGIPFIPDPNLVVVSHNVKLTISAHRVDVSSVTLFKNNGPATTVMVHVPVGQVGLAAAPSGITATWANAPIALGPRSTETGQADTISTVSVQSLGSYALRLHYSHPVGRSGLDRKKRLVAYSLQSPAPIGTLMVSFVYNQSVVFHLPDVGPGTSWEIGEKGSFTRLPNYDGKLGLAYCSFYPGGF
jgi:hypothetical protein